MITRVDVKLVDSRLLSLSNWKDGVGKRNQCSIYALQFPTARSFFEGNNTENYNCAWCGKPSCSARLEFELTNPICAISLVILLADEHAFKTRFIYIFSSLSKKLLFISEMGVGTDLTSCLPYSSLSEYLHFEVNLQMGLIFSYRINSISIFLLLETLQIQKLKNINRFPWICISMTHSM